MKPVIDDAAAIGALRFGPDGLVPVVAQDEATGAVLMLAWANAAALQQSLDTGRMTYWSRSRGQLWVKGEESGHAQHVVALGADCDGDAVLAVVRQEGPACHEATGTCWTSGADAPVATWLGVIDSLAAGRLVASRGRYTDALLAEPALAAAKVVEEANEVARVLRGEPNEDSLEHEAADLLYHLVVAVRAGGGGLATVLRELQGRAHPDADAA